jgi:hypothetical protein
MRAQVLMLGFLLAVRRQRTAIGSHALTPHAYDVRCRWRETRGGRLNIGDPPQRIFERNIGSEIECFCVLGSKIKACHMEDWQPSLRCFTLLYPAIVRGPGIELSISTKDGLGKSACLGSV